MTYTAFVVRLTRTGGPEVPRIEQSSINELGAGQVWLEQDAIGNNYLDVTQRNGAVPLQLPPGLGLEGAGRVAAIGPGVTNVKGGDRVAYATGPIGSYASGRVYPAERLVHLPSDLSPTDAASVLFKGDYGAVPSEVDLSRRSDDGRPDLRRSRWPRAINDAVGQASRRFRDRSAAPLI